VDKYRISTDLLPSIVIHVEALCPGTRYTIVAVIDNIETHTTTLLYDYTCVEHDAHTVMSHYWFPHLSLRPGV